MPRWSLTLATVAAATLLTLSLFAQDEPAAEEKAPAAEAAKEAPAAEEPAAEKPAAEAPKEAPAEEKPAEEKPAEEKPAAEKPAAEEPAAETPAPEVAPKVLVNHLDNPSGLAIHAGTGHVFIASHQGVFRFDPKTPKKIYLEVMGFPTDVYGKGPKYNIGPLGLTMLGDSHLVVGDGSRPDGEELVRVYKIGAEAPEKPAAEDSAEFTLGPITAGDLSARGEGNYYGVAATASAIFVTNNGDDTKGWISKSVVTDGKPGDLVPTIATKEATEVDAPVPVTVSPDGKSLVVGQMGEVNVPGDALLTMYDIESGELTGKMAMGLSDPCGLAYSPKTGSLYVTDFAWADSTQGGLFRLDIEGEEVKATKILALDKPTAIIFDAEGGLYLTTFGTAEEGSELPSGEMHYIAPGL